MAVHNPPGVDRGEGWRGPREAEAQVLRYRWQRDWAAQAWQRLSLRNTGRVARGALLLVAFLVLLVVVCYDLLFPPVKTPLLTIAAPAYPWPLPVNSWSAEDVADLSDLDKQSLQYSDCSDAWASKQRGLRVLDQQLEQIVKQGSPNNVIIIYLSAHGVVNGEGRPCLLLPDGSPLKSESWLPLAEVLERFKSPAIPEKWQKLLVLDCNRIDSDWSLGQLENGFAAHLPAAVQAAGIPNLVVLNSCSPGETGWAGPSLQGSSFGHFLRRGMAGEADAKDSGGNGNGRVSLHELHQYVTSEVGRWARTQRAAPQQPMLIPSDAADYSVVWTLSKKWQTQLQLPTAEFVPPVTSDQIAALWRDHDRLLAHNPHRFDPCQWTEVQQQLLRLEQLVRSGAGYASAVAGTHADLRRRLKAMTDRAAQLEPGAGIASWRVFSPREAELPTRLPLHSRRLESFMGTNQAVARTPAGPALTDPAAPDSPLPASAAPAPPTERLTGVLLEDHAARVLRRFWPAGGDMELLQTAIANVALSERAAIPSDERAQYALRSLVDPADVQRRRAVDASMLDDERSVGIARAGWAKSREQFNEVQQAADDLRDAFATRDRAWSLAPFLAAWLARPLPEGEPAGPWDQKINAVLLPLLQANESLAEVLESTTQNKDVPISSVTQARADVEAKLSQLEAYFAEQCVLLSKAGRSPRTLRNLQAVLATPLVPAAQRADLNRRRDELEQYLSKQEPEKDDSPPPAATSLAERSSVNWQEHPLLVLTGAESKKHDDASTDKGDAPRRRRAAHASPHRMGEEVRLALLRIATQANQAATAAADESAAGKTGDLDAIRAARLSLGRLVNRVRRTAPYCATAVRNDPVHRLRRFDLQQLMLWQAQRSLDDFWGPASDRDEAFFAKAAGESLRLAADLAEPDAAVQSQLTKLERRLQTLRLAARKGLLPTASDVLLVNEAEDAKIETGVQPGPEELVKSLPPGEGTLLLRDAQGRLAGAGRGFSLLDAFTGDRAARQFEIPLASDVLAQRGPVLDAVALFRGNVYQTPFLLRAADGPRVEFSPYRYGPPKLTVAGRSKKKASILFILDCSASMSAAITVEAPGDSRRATRMDAAKASLMKMLDQLAATENTRVGVRLFGHRAGWNVRVADQILRQTAYARPIPDDLTPGDDVETLLPLGRFDSSAAGEVRDVLKTVKPWGETPLYLSLIESIKDFATDEPDTEKSIVVITDGANYQFNARSPKSRDDVIAAGRKIPIHIVGFDIPESDAQQAKRDYTYIAEQTKGSFVAVSASTSLVQQLEGLLGNSMFTVADSSGREIAQARVGTSIELPPGDGRAATVTVGLGSASKTITAEPGDGIELTLSADGKRIEPQFSQGKDATYLPMTRKGGGALKLLGGLQRPYWRDGGLVFSIYFRPEDKELLRRPAETWIQVRPGGKSGATGDEYNFYDANFEPDAPLPALRWNAPRWPVKATTAEVQVWCKMTPTRPTWTVRLDEALADDMRSIEKELDGLRGLTYQVYARAGTGDSDPYRIAVVERHSADAPLDAIKVELSARPLKVRRTFDAEHRIVAHVFEVSPSDAQPLSNLSLRITRKEDLLDGAWQWKEPMTVAIPEPGDVIRLAPASGKSF